MNTEHGPVAEFLLEILRVMDPQWREIEEITHTIIVLISDNSEEEAITNLTNFLTADEIDADIVQGIDNFLTALKSDLYRQGDTELSARVNRIYHEVYWGGPLRAGSSLLRNIQDKLNIRF